jgi:hypothetical protein
MFEPSLSRMIRRLQATVPPQLLQIKLCPEWSVGAEPSPSDDSEVG